MDERLSGVPMTDPHKRIGNKVKDYSMKPVTQQVRQVDGGTWNGPKIAKSNKEVELIRWIKLMKTKDQDVAVRATLGDFIQKVEDAYLLGKGSR